MATSDKKPGRSRIKSIFSPAEKMKAAAPPQLKLISNQEQHKYSQRDRCSAAGKQASDMKMQEYTTSVNAKCVSVFINEFPNSLEKVICGKDHTLTFSKSRLPTADSENAHGRPFSQINLFLCVYIYMIIYVTEHWATFLLEKSHLF